MHYTEHTSDDITPYVVLVETQSGINLGLFPCGGEVIFSKNICTKKKTDTIQLG